MTFHLFFEVIRAPMVEALLYPGLVLNASSQKIDFIGRHFHPDRTYTCRIHDTSYDVTVINSTFLTCTVDLTSAGLATFSVFENSFTVSSLTSLSTQVITAPILISTSPKWYYEFTTPTFTLFGEEFDSATNCLFDDIPVATTLISAQQLLCTPIAPFTNISVIKHNTFESNVTFILYFL